MMAWLVRKVTGRSYSELFIFLGLSHPDPAARRLCISKRAGSSDHKDCNSKCTQNSYFFR